MWTSFQVNNFDYSPLTNIWCAPPADGIDEKLYYICQYKKRNQLKIRASNLHFPSSFFRWRWWVHRRIVIASPQTTKKRRRRRKTITLAVWSDYISVVDRVVVALVVCCSFFFVLFLLVPHTSGSVRWFSDAREWWKEMAGGKWSRAARHSASLPSIVTRRRASGVLQTHTNARLFLPEGAGKSFVLQRRVGGWGCRRMLFSSPHGYSRGATLTEIRADSELIIMRRLMWAASPLTQIKSSVF